MDDDGHRSGGLRDTSLHRTYHGYVSSHAFVALAEARKVWLGGKRRSLSGADTHITTSAPSVKRLSRSTVSTAPYFCRQGHFGFGRSWQRGGAGVRLYAQSGSGKVPTGRVEK